MSFTMNRPEVYKTDLGLGIETTTPSGRVVTAETRSTGVTFEWTLNPGDETPSIWDLTKFLPGPAAIRAVKEGRVHRHAHSPDKKLPSRLAGSGFDLLRFDQGSTSVVFDFGPDVPAAVTIAAESWKALGHVAAQLASDDVLPVLGMLRKALANDE